MKYIFLILVAVIAVFFIAIMVANGIYRQRMNTFLRWPNAKATIISGENKGRSGVIVSHYPFDIIVEINTRPTAAELDAWVLEEKKKFPQPEHAAWIKENSTHFRKWIKAWRWEVEFDYSEVH